jgi:hypothetical protein
MTHRFVPPTFAGDHENDTMTARHSIAEESQTCPVRPLRRHAVQIDARIRITVTFSQAVCCPPVQPGLRSTHRSLIVNSR